MSKITESIVLVGGGGGVYRIARFLKHIRPNITTIQTVFDHGRHSGQLRDERGVLPPGDIRQAIVALSDDQRESTLRKLMTYRFLEKGTSSLNNATVGNILLTALTEIEGGLPAAIHALCELCGVRGKVLPVSLTHADLCVRLSDGSLVRGEGNIDNRSIDDNRTITEVSLDPKAHILVDAYEALVNAEKIVLCPGDLYTSLIPNLLVEGFLDALLRSKAQLIYCTNIMTKKAETDGFDVVDFARVINGHIGGRMLDHLICNSENVSGELVEKYGREKSHPVKYNRIDEIKGYANHIIAQPLIDSTGGVIRHHERIASIIANI